MVHMVVGRRHSCLPNLALVQFAVTQQGVDIQVLAVQFGCRRHTAGHRQALAQRAGGIIDALDLQTVHVLGQAAAVLVQLLEPFAVDKAQIGKNHIQGRAGVALAEDEPVPVGPVGLLGTGPHNVIVQCGQNLNGRQRTAKMAAAGTVDGLKGFAPQFLCFFVQHFIHLISQESVTPVTV